MIEQQDRSHVTAFDVNHYCRALFDMHAIYRPLKAPKQKDNTRLVRLMDCKLSNELLY